MVVEICKRIPYECECIHIPQHITEENSSTIRADIRRFLPQVVSLEFCYDYSFDVVFINKYGCKLISHIEKGDLACMVDFHMNDESSINIQDRSNNVISW